MPEPMLIAQSKSPLYLLPAMSNRHGLIAGATGTGKTVTLQVMAEAFSRIGVPVFAADCQGGPLGDKPAGSRKCQDCRPGEETQSVRLLLRRLPGDLLGRLRRRGTSTRPSSMPLFCCGCSASSLNVCRRWEMRKSPSWCSFSMKLICCFPICPR